MTDIYSDFVIAGLSSTERSPWSVDREQRFHPLYGEQSRDKTLLSVRFHIPQSRLRRLVAGLQN